MSTAGARSLLARLHPREQPIERLAAVAVALLAGVAVFWIASDLFPHHSANHDEAVYLQQASMLLEGRIDLHAGPIADAVRPWFFVQDGGRLYPKYQPYPAALFAVPMGLLGAPRLALAAVAAGNVALVYVLGSQAFDRRVGVVAAVAFATAPMTLLATSAFLPYAPTTLLNLAFAVCYLRAYRERSVRLGALAGAATGLAFFARPYTAVLFAASFVGHACWQLVGSLRGIDLRAVARDRDRLPEPLRRNGATAAVGLAFVGLSLAYNAVLTGDPLRFPYAAFAPEDGPGFGHREIVGHSIEYTPDLALEANAHVLWALLTRWGPAGPVGTVLAVGGVVLAARGWRARRRESSDAESTEPAHTESMASGRDDRAEPLAQALLAGLFVTVAAGNVAFWGNYNVLADFDDPTDGLLGLFGPFYHFDLLAPLSVFAAAGLLGAWRWVRAWEQDPAEADSSVARLPDAISPRAVRTLGLAAVVLLAVTGGVAGAALVQGPADRHAEHTAYYETAYEPFEDRNFDDAVVFLPTPYGDWLNHPFQSLRNDGGLDGDAVYALDRHPESDFAVLDATGDRTVYRYTYRGEWTPGGESVVPRLQPLEVRSGERLAGETVVGVPDRVERATVRLETGPGEYATYDVRDPGGSIAVSWTLDREGATLSTSNGTADASQGSDAGERLPIDDHDEVGLQVRLVAADGSTLTYRQEAEVRRTADGVAAIWPPERTVCTLVDDCGREGTYLPDRPDEHVDGVSFETRLDPAA